MISEALASILRSGRDHFNAAFAEARRRYPDLDAAAFKEFLQTTVETLMRSATALSSEQQVSLVMAAYQTGLELVGERLAGSDSRPRVIERGWEQILPSVIPLLAASPAPLLSAVSNALHTLSCSHGARPAQWCQQLQELGPRCPDLPTFLKLGQVLAWRAGLAHFRQGALEAAQSLPEALAVAAVGAAPSAAWPALYEQLANDPWFDPAAQRPNSPSSAGPRLYLATKVGSFRGFGGNFVEPPEVASTGDQLLVRSADECWWLLADAFGATLRRATLIEFEAAKPRKTLPVNLELTRTQIIRGRDSLSNPAPGGMSSFAAAGRTLALTSALSYRVALIAL
jgi:hypothetical protein